MKTAKILTLGNSQVIRLPEEYHLEGDEVYIKKTGEMIILIPTSTPWDPLIGSLGMFSADFMEEREQPTLPETTDLPE